MNEMTLAEWLDKWYNLYAKPFLKTSTLVSYNGYIKNHIKPFIGQLKLTDLNGIVLQEFFNEKYKSGRLDHKGGLSEKTVLNIRQMLHAALRKALENGFIPANYVEHVRLQKVSIPDMRVLTEKYYVNDADKNVMLARYSSEKQQLEYYNVYENQLEQALNSDNFRDYILENCFS